MGGPFVRRAPSILEKPYALVTEASRRNIKHRQTHLWFSADLSLEILSERKGVCRC
jgi:predicted ATPase